MILISGLTLKIWDCPNVLSEICVDILTTGPPATVIILNQLKCFDQFQKKPQISFTLEHPRKGYQP